MSTNEITEQVEDALTYPILTQQVDGQQPSTGTQGVSITPSGSIDSVAQSTIRRVLGWRYRANDTKGFTAALTKSFALKEVVGHVEWELKPQNYMVQADLGEVTGAQASIYTRAKAAMDQALPLLDGLTPLRVDADPEDCEAIRALVRTELRDQLVPELGKPGGPVVQLVQQVFTLLLGSGTPISDLETVGGHLGELRFRFGLERKRVNTVAEEVNLTNFLIVVDYINSLYITWIAQKKFLGRQGLAEPFLGTQLVLLSQQLEELAESVSEAYDAMDSVFFGPAERQTTQLKFPGQPFITVAELLAWVEKFATVDGPQWLQDSGKDGVGLVASTGGQLYDLVKQASQKSKSGSSNPTRAFHTARVHRAFDVIRDGLEATADLAIQIKTVDQPRPPKPVATQAITRVDPPNDNQGANPAHLKIYGFGLARVTKAYLEPSDPKQQVLSTDAKVLPTGATNFYDSLIAAGFDLTDAQPGIYALILRDPLGNQIALKDAFTVTVPPPKIVTVEPLTSDQEDVVRLDINGTGFQRNAAVTLELQGSNRNPNGEISFLSDTQIVATFDLSLVIEGDWNLVVTNPDGQKSNPKPFQIVLPAPVIQSFVPRFGAQYQPLVLRVQGHNLRPGITVALQSQCGQGSIQCDKSAKVVGSNIVIATFDGSKVTPPGEYYVIVTNSDNQSAWSDDLLEICSEYTDGALPKDDAGKPSPPPAEEGAGVLAAKPSPPPAEEGAGAVTVEPIPKPVINRVHAAVNEDSEVLRLMIEGSGFEVDAVAIIASGSPSREHVGEVRSISNQRIVSEFDMSQMMTPLHTVLIENPNGIQTEPRLIEHAPLSPVIESFVPPFISLSEDLKLIIRGRHIQPNAEIWLRAKDLPALKDGKAEILTARTIRSSFSLKQIRAVPGLYHVVVVNPGGLQHWSKEYLEILPPPASPSSPIDESELKAKPNVGTELVPEPKSTAPAAPTAATVPNEPPKKRPRPTRR